MSILSLIPYPVSMALTGGTWRLSTKPTISFDPAGTDTEQASLLLADMLKTLRSVPANIIRGTSGSEPASDINLRISANAEADLVEPYTLTISKSGVTMEASSYQGLVWAIQTFAQLLPTGSEIPCLVCQDHARFTWRGMHLDVSRHFFPVEFILKYLELLSKYKLNIFHWHLTDDQGWRLEIGRYPRLTEIGAWRTEEDGSRYGGYYTGDDVQAVVAHARRLGITVVPEIDLPGHASALLAAYPKLSCFKEPVEIPATWGIFNNTLCPSRESTYKFVEDLLAEVCAMFDAPFVHIGGDECPTANWERHKYCRTTTTRQKLSNCAGLHGHFNRRVAHILEAVGRRMVGWDEVTSGDLPTEVAIMCWRNQLQAVDAVMKGHEVILSPMTHCYFDFYQDLEGEPKAIGGHLPLKKVYGFEPIPEGVSGADAHKVLGGQANVWTEFMPESSHVEYMTIPRICALAETLWSTPEIKDVDGFLQRLPQQLETLSRSGYHYRPL